MKLKIPEIPAWDNNYATKLIPEISYILNNGYYSNKVFITVMIENYKMLIVEMVDETSNQP